MRSNPNYSPGKPCVYVGMTGLDPDVRFDKHKAGIQANRYVKEYGQRLLPELYELYNPLTYDEARSLEVELGIALRDGGFGVWQARRHWPDIKWLLCDGLWSLASVSGGLNPHKSGGSKWRRKLAAESGGHLWCRILAADFGAHSATNR